MSDRKPARAGLCEREGRRLARYRYRTPVLTGPWRDSPDAALRDAVGAHQALADDGAPGGVRWLVPGEIEEEAGGRAVPVRAGRR